MGDAKVIMELQKGEAKNRKQQFWVHAVSDKVLINGRIRYLLFFDGDEKYRGPPMFANAFSKVFPTRNGFHAVGTTLGSADDKAMWFFDWIEKYPDSDYILANLQWLAPASKEELEFILDLCRPELPLLCMYYRDKAVLETVET